MGRTLNRRSVSLAVAALFFLMLGAVSLVFFLRTQGLDHAEKWISAAGVVTAALIGLVGLLLARKEVGDERPADQDTDDDEAHGGGRATTGRDGLGRRP